jgi:plasmid stability protein
MPSLTIRDIPPKLHRTLKARAERNRRSLQAEVLWTLEEAVEPRRVPAEEMLERVRQFRMRVRVRTTDAEIRRFKRQGRA